VAERADAARNRRLLLDAALEIATDSGVGALTMEAVAARAGVGVGTVYRRFKDRAGLANALLDDSERQFQDAFIHGPPPLGPGAPPATRVRAFLHAYIDRLDLRADLLVLAEMHSPTSRFHSPPYRTQRAHLAALVGRAQPSADATYLADALLAVVGAGLFLHQRRELGYTLAQVKTGVDQLLGGLCAPDAGCPPDP